MLTPLPPLSPPPLFVAMPSPVGARHLSFRPEILALFVYTILLIMWLKFLVIWRLFRFWALCDGVEPPENMQVRTNPIDVGGYAHR